MLEAVKFPAGISDLNTGLTDVDRNALSHFLGLKEFEEIGGCRRCMYERRLSRRLPKCEISKPREALDYIVEGFKKTSGFFNYG
jgi:hypothetical protein